MRPPDQDQELLAAAARAVLERDGVDLVLRPWQVGYLLSIAEGRPAGLPSACGLGRGWVQARLDEALAALKADAAGAEP
jgi:hypothetical protein